MKETDFNYDLMKCPKCNGIEFIGKIPTDQMAVYRVAISANESDDSYNPFEFIGLEGGDYNKEFGKCKSLVSVECIKCGHFEYGKTSIMMEQMNREELAK